MGHQLSPTSVKFPPRQLHQTVEESSQEVSPDQLEDKTTRKGSKGKVLFILRKTGFNINTFEIIPNELLNCFFCSLLLCPSKMGIEVTAFGLLASENSVLHFFSGVILSPFPFSLPLL